MPGPFFGEFLEAGAPLPYYNEIVLDGGYWNAHLPGSVEAIVGSSDAHRQFLATYGVQESEFPLVMLDLHNWERPFSAG